MASEAAERLKVPLTELPGRVGRLIEERKEAQKQIDDLRARKSSSSGGGDLFSTAREIPGVSGANLMTPGDPATMVEALRLAGLRP